MDLARIWLTAGPFRVKDSICTVLLDHKEELGNILKYVEEGEGLEMSL